MQAERERGLQDEEQRGGKGGLGEDGENSGGWWGALSVRGVLFDCCPGVEEAECLLPGSMGMFALAVYVRSGTIDLL